MRQQQGDRALPVLCTAVVAPRDLLSTQLLSLLFFSLSSSDSPFLLFFILQFLSPELLRLLRLLLLRLLLPLLACDARASSSKRVHQRRLTSGRGGTLLLRPYRVYYLLPLLYLLLCQQNAMIHQVETGPFLREHG